MEFVKDFLIYEAGALCGFFIAALMNAARADRKSPSNLRRISMEQEKNTLTVLEIAPGQYPKQVEIDPDLKALQQAVGGNIGASYPFSDPVAIVYNDMVS